jgi:hypothetical protein
MFTARFICLRQIRSSHPPSLIHQQWARYGAQAEFTEGFFLFLFGDPGGIGSAFHRAQDPEKK